MRCFSKLDQINERMHRVLYSLWYLCRYVGMCDYDMMVAYDSISNLWLWLLIEVKKVCN